MAVATTTASRLSRFVQWIDEVTPRVVAEQLNVSVWAVYGWRRHAMGEKGGSRPSPDRLGAILRLAKGKLSAIDIYPEEPKV
jgi:hypothetical protein